MKTNEHTSTVAVYLLLWRDRKIHLIRRSNTSYQNGRYSVIAGHVEVGELPMAAMVREAKEEGGIEIHPADLIFKHLSCRPEHDGTGNRVDIFFSCTTWKGELRNAEPDKCDKFIWVDMIDLLGYPVTPHVLVGIIASSDEMSLGYSELTHDYIKARELYKEPCTDPRVLSKM